MKNGSRYFIKIVENQGDYVFQFWYIAKQEMGSSKIYNTYKECVEGVISFKEYLRRFNPSEENGFIKISKLGERYYKYEFYDENGLLLYASRKIESKANCKKSMASTCKHFVEAEIYQ